MSSALNTAEWRKPRITVPKSQRIRIAQSAIEKALFNLGGNGLFAGDSYHSALLYAQMAEFDLLSNGTRYKDQLARYLQTRKGETISTSSIQQTRYFLDLGRAAVRAYAVYKDDTFLQLAEAWWQWARLWTVSDAAASSKAAPGKSAPLPSNCSGHSLAGGAFHDTNPANAYVGIIPTGDYLVLSSLLSEATANQTYLDHATQTFTFIKNLLLNTTTMIPNDSIFLNASDPISCSTEQSPSSYCSGVYIDGLAAFSAVANETLKPEDQLISKSYVAAMTAKDWHSADGVLRVTPGGGGMGHADFNLPWGLGVLYRRTENDRFKSDIEKYLAVQYNAILDLSTVNGSNIYPEDWIGPPTSTFSLTGQVTALGVLVPVIALSDTDSTDSNSTAGPASPLPSSRKTPIGGIVGGVVGGVLLLVALVALFLVWRRRKGTPLTESGALAQTQDLHIEAFTESARPSSGSILGQGQTPKSQASRKSTRGGIPQGSQRFSTTLTSYEQDDRELLGQMGAALSIMNWRLTRVEESGTVGRGMDEPPQYPGSAHS
ncbi:hypothetical protein V5O48_010872 [Marasmius crinis-equi]|uniref:Glycoside hydrolase family 76 protein n=1 Tax=Marasmius crinis-equi TaxID=585013 RepID=A0ABR3F759_9AGAR